MTLTKARDYFSAYYEGSIDRGLKQAFEARIKEDGQLQAEYRAFVRTMKELEAFGALEIEPPADLHDRIAARLDKAIWEQKRQKAAPLTFAWWKGLAAVSLAAACIIGVVAISAHEKTQSVAPASIAGGTFSSIAKFTFTSSGPTARGVSMSFPAMEANVLIKDASGNILSSLELANRPIDDKPLVNSANETKLLAIEADGSDNVIASSYVVLPGKVRDGNDTGKGTVKDLAFSIAGRFDKPVVIENQADGQKSASWDLTTNDLLGAATESLKASGLSITELNNGILSIRPNN